MPTPALKPAPANKVFFAVARLEIDGQGIVSAKVTQLTATSGSLTLNKPTPEQFFTTTGPVILSERLESFFLKPYIQRALALFK